MTAAGAPQILFSESAIAARVEEVARAIAAAPPEIAAPVLVGGFVFAGDLLRALARRGLSLPVEFLWLKSYAARASAGEVRVLAGPGEAVRARHVLLIDGVLDGGATIAKARALLQGNGARVVSVAVAVDKRRDDALAKADYALFTGARDFLVGYGMDDAGAHRALPYIARLP